MNIFARLLLFFTAVALINVGLVFHDLPTLNTGTGSHMSPVVSLLQWPFYILAAILLYHAVPTLESPSIGRKHQASR